MFTDLENVKWIHGSADCAVSTDPLIQTEHFARGSFALRVSKCFTFEGNFLYLLCGRERAILFDTGGRPDSGDPSEVLPVRGTVDRLLRQWEEDSGAADVELIVAHTHSHSDHAFWDRQFVNRPRTTVIATSLDAVTGFFGLVDWPEGQNLVELGDRTLTVMPLPGHEDIHIAVHDSQTKVMLTGDTLYPGLLTVRDWPAYRRSAVRLAEFTSANDISYVLGAHIEMKDRPREFYPIGATFQPDEHRLPLTPAHVNEWHAACEAMANAPTRSIHDDFIIEVL